MPVQITLYVYNLFSTGLPSVLNLNLNTFENQKTSVFNILKNFNNYDKLNYNDYKILGLSLSLLRKQDTVPVQSKNEESLQIQLGL